MLPATLVAPEAYTPLQAAVLGAVQGLTELLPVSSSAHLYVVPTLLGWPYAGLAFDVALHGGTLLALVIAFWGDWLAMVRDAFSRDAAVAREARLLWAKLAAASVPAAIAGKAFGDFFEFQTRALPLQATTLFAFGLVLWLADRFRPAGAETRSPSWAQAMAIGFAQCLALVPGVSRSGITMTAGRMGGLARVSSARFSFLLATPITFGAFLVKIPDVPSGLPVSTVLIGVASAAVFGVLAIRLLLGMLRTTGFGVFFAYRAALALGILAFWLARR